MLHYAAARPMMFSSQAANVTPQIRVSVSVRVRVRDRVRDRDRDRVRDRVPCGGNGEIA